MKYGIIDYEIIGEGEPILFIHGWGLDKTVLQASFEPILRMGSGYKRFYIDLPGMGKSEHGHVRNSDDILELLHDFAVEIIGEKFMIIGQSYGGLLARGFVNRFGDMVSRMVLICPCVIPGVRQGRVEPLVAVERDEEFLSTLTWEEYDSFTQMNVILTRPVWEKYKKILMPALSRADWDYLNTKLEGSFSFDPDDMEPSDMQVLILCGKHDSEVGYKDQFDLMRIYPKANYCALENAGHNLLIEQTELFIMFLFIWFFENRLNEVIERNAGQSLEGNQSSGL